MKELGVWARDDDTEDAANSRGHVRRWKKGTEGMEKREGRGERETIHTSIFLGATGVVLACEGGERYTHRFPNACWFASELDSMDEGKWRTYSVPLETCSVPSKMYTVCRSRGLAKANEKRSKLKVQFGPGFRVMGDTFGWVVSASVCNSTH